MTITSDTCFSSAQVKAAQDLLAIADDLLIESCMHKSKNVARRDVPADRLARQATSFVTVCGALSRIDAPASLRPAIKRLQVRLDEFAPFILNRRTGVLVGSASSLNEEQHLYRQAANAILRPASF